MKKYTNKRKKNLWSGRFAEMPSDHMSDLNASIKFDKELYEVDIEASICHAEMLANQNIIKNNEFEKIQWGLLKIKDEIKNNKMTFKNELEDIHTHIETRLIKIIGPTGKNFILQDQEMIRFQQQQEYGREKNVKNVDSLLKKLQVSLLKKAEKHFKDIMPGFTHLQPAQPILLSHHLLAYVNMFGRDRENCFKFKQT